MDFLSKAYLLLAGLNVVSFALYGFDKHQAKIGGRRISERTLLMSAVFGVVGALLGMYVFRHKTKKPLFRYGVPVVLLAELAMALCFLRVV